MRGVKGNMARKSGSRPRPVEPSKPNTPELPDSILVINDDPAGCNFISGLLRYAGYEVLEAASDAEALKVVLQALPNLIILDGKPPGESALEVLRQLKAAPQTRHIPGLHISTSHDNDAAVVAGLDAGADSCLTKPVEPVVLLATCRSLLRLAKAERLAEEALRLSEQRAREAEMGRQLAETLNSEVNHRVRNNLTMVVALLQIQSTASDLAPNAVRALQETAARVMTFARIHEQLQTEAEGRVNLLQVVHQLTDMVKDMVAEKRINLEVEGEPVLLDADTATRLAMVANELLINAAKHGAPSPSGEFHIRVELGAEAGKLHLSVWNSGQPRTRAEGQSGGLGLQLVRGLIAQHRGHFALKSYNGGSLAEVVMETPHPGRMPAPAPGISPA
jgi:two-component sensor histidine kinase